MHRQRLLHRNETQVLSREVHFNQPTSVQLNNNSHPTIINKPMHITMTNLYLSRSLSRQKLDTYTAQ
jgi:hypothetical protein